MRNFMVNLTKGLRKAPSLTAAAKQTYTSEPVVRSTPIRTAPVRSKAAPQKKPRSITQAPDDQCFWVNNGPVLRSAADLYYAMKEMTDEQYEYHTKRDGNDFANWVRHVLDDAALAGKLARAKTRKNAIQALGEYGG